MGLPDRPVLVPFPAVVLWASSAILLYCVPTEIVLALTNHHVLTVTTDKTDGCGERRWAAFDNFQQEHNSCAFLKAGIQYL